MPYKVFFVEDEIEIREGIRDNVDWTAYGFEFCGEAPDGEMALPLMQTLKPDVLITDIRMPFMDGLQLSQIVRDRLPATKVIILSGHDEFEYAQQAIKLGVFAYLLKPVSMQELIQVLQKVARELEQERGEQQALQKLRDQIEQNRAALRERFLLRLVAGVASPAEAIETSQSMGLDLIARRYLVVAIRIEPSDRSEQPGLQKFLHAQELASTLVENNPDAFLLRKDLCELVLLLKGSSAENLYEERDLILARLRQALEGTECEMIAGSGTPQTRISDIRQSFSDAAASLQHAARGRTSAFVNGFDEATLLEVDKSAVEDYLRSGTADGFDSFFESFSRPLGARTLSSPVAKSYIFTDVALTTARFVYELGGNADQIVPELRSLETIVASIQTMEHLRESARKILVAALAFRDNLVIHGYAGIIKQAQACMDRRYVDPELSLSDVAAHVNLSASYFSSVFSKETGQTFKEYLTELRIKRAKELLRTTTLKAFEVGYQVGYNDPHYFSHVFHKNTGLTPLEFRLQAQAA